MKMNDLVVAIHSVKSRASKALIKGDHVTYAQLMADLYQLELLAPALGVELITIKELSLDALDTMFDNDEMWYLYGEVSVIYYDLPVLDC